VNVAERARNAFIRKGLTLTAIAEQLDCSRGHVSRLKAADKGTRRDWDKAKLAHLARSPLNTLDALDAQLAHLANQKRKGPTWSDELAKTARARKTIAERNSICRATDGIKLFRRYCEQTGLPAEEMAAISKRVGDFIEGMREGRFGVQE